MISRELFAKRLAQVLERPESQFHPDATLVGDIGLDDFQLFQLVVFMEEMAPCDEIGRLKWKAVTVGELYTIYAHASVDRDVLHRD
jgi:hypothetical protein